jgi:hypothetical protein
MSGGQDPLPGWYPPLEGAQWSQPVEFPAAEPESGPALPVKRNWLVPTALAVGVAGVTAAVTLAVVWWPRATVSTTPTSVSSAAPVTIQQVAPTSTTPPLEMISSSVRTSMQRNLDSDPDFKGLGLKVVDVTLVHKSGNEYKGIATVRGSDGVSHDVPVDVTADDANTLWETPKGAFSFVDDKPPPPAAPQLPASAPGSVENFKICPSGLSGVASDETSCAFADSVRSSWYSNPGPSVVAYSPVTHQSYLMHCAPAVTDVWPEAVRCAGVNAQGTVLVVYIDQHNR